MYENKDPRNPMDVVHRAVDRKAGHISFFVEVYGYKADRLP